jgi:hypothetical protein
MLHVLPLHSARIYYLNNRRLCEVQFGAHFASSILPCLLCLLTADIGRCRQKRAAAESVIPSSRDIVMPAYLGSRTFPSPLLQSLAINVLAANCISRPYKKLKNIVLLSCSSGSRRGSTWPRGYTPCWQVYTNKTRVMPFIPIKFFACMSTSWLLGNVYTAKSCKGKKRDPDALKLGLVG